MVAVAVTRIPAVDGVRGLAVLAVLLYHGAGRPLPGGYLGVELFFVLTGFLVSSLVAGEFAATGAVRLRRFWFRRLDRLAPELLALVAVVLVCALLFAVGRVAELRNESLSALFFVSNWHSIFVDEPYFRQFDAPSVLLHLWSIGVEGQLYLLSAPLLAFLLYRRSRRAVIATVLVLAAASALLGVVLSFGGYESFIYYGTPTRASGFLIGAALALAWRPADGLPGVSGGGAPARSLDRLAFFATAGLVAAFVFLDADSALLYRGGFLLVDLLGVALIVAVAHPRSGLAARAFGIAPLAWLGQRSYGIYLWHWPLFVLLGEASWLPIDGPLLLVVESAIALLVAEVSFRAIYRPGRRALERWRAGEVRLPRPRGFVQHSAFMLGGIVLGGAFALIVVASPPGRPDYLPSGSFHGIVSASGAPSPSPSATATPTATPTHTATPLPTVTVTAAATPTATPSPTPLPPTATPTLPPPPPPLDADVLAIGDSVMIGAAPALGILGTVEVDAHEGRQMAEYIRIVQARAAAGTLPDTVVIHAGNNGPFHPGELQAIMAALGPSRTVVFVNVRVKQPWQDESNTTLLGVANYPNARLVDWYGATAGRDDLFWDGMHVRPEGAQLYATLIAQALSW